MFSEIEEEIRMSESYNEWVTATDKLLRCVSESLQLANNLNNSEKASCERKIRQFLNDTNVKYHIDDFDNGPGLCTFGDNDELLAMSKIRVNEKLRILSKDIPEIGAICKATKKINDLSGAMIYLYRKRTSILTTADKANYLKEVEEIIKRSRCNFSDDTKAREYFWKIYNLDTNMVVTENCVPELKMIRRFDDNLLPFFEIDFSSVVENKYINIGNIRKFLFPWEV